MFKRLQKFMRFQEEELAAAKQAFPGG